MRDDLCWTFRKNSLEVIELSCINKVSLVCSVRVSYSTGYPPKNIPCQTMEDIHFEYCTYEKLLLRNDSLTKDEFSCKFSGQSF